MKNTTGIAGLVFAALVGACAPEESPPPPLFNALDPSQSCEAGKVGWDFTTGGSAGAVIPASVGTEIRLKKATYYCKGWSSPGDGGVRKNIDLVTSFRRDCDGKVRCERPIIKTTSSADGGTTVPDSDTLDCTERGLFVQYSCGNETTVYSINRAFAPSATGVLQQTPDKTKPTDLVRLACADKMNFIGHTSQFADGHWSGLANDRVLPCEGYRNCNSNDATWAKDYAYTGNQTLKWYYRCAQNTSVLTYTATRGTQVDFACPDPTTVTDEGVPLIRVKGVDQDAPTAAGSTTAKSIFDGLRAACDGKRNCEYLGPVLPASFGNFSVEYWCGSSNQRAEKLNVHLGRYQSDPANQQRLSLKCGARLTITDGTKPWVTKSCPSGVRLCSSPPDAGETSLTYFCDGYRGAANSTATLASAYSATRTFPHDLTCPIETDRTGIQLTALCSGGFCDGSPDFSAVNACQNQLSCALPKPASYQSYRYTCSGTNETKYSVEFQSNGKTLHYLDCRAKPKVTGISGCVTLPSTALKCTTVSEDGCTVALESSSVTASQLAACTTDLTVNYNCGTTPNTATLKPMASDAGYKVTVNCPYDPTPKATTSTKACVPASCPYNSRRSAALECEQDNTIAVLTSATAKAYFSGLDGGAALTSVREGYPYVAQAKITYPGTPTLTTENSAVIWAYDVFRQKAAPNAEVKAFRCIVGGGSIAAHETSTVAVTRGSGGVLPPECFRQYPVGSWKGSWYNASRVAKVNEVTFRDQYELLRTNVVVSFDVSAHANLKSRSAPNPIGFFYDPATSYINQYDFYAQTADFTNQLTGFTFTPTGRIDLVPASVTADQAVVHVGGSNRPAMDFNFAWKILGESPANGFAQQPLTSAFASPLYSKHPRATVEIAKYKAGVANLWTADNTGAFPAVALGAGNALEKVDRLTARLPPWLVSRMLTVRKTSPPNDIGWMDNNIEINSVFQARVCLDIDGITHLPGDMGLDNQFLSKSVGNETFEVGFTKRCTEPVTFTVIRDIFKTPTLPLLTQETGVGSAATTDQGGDKVSSASDNGTQADCRTPCTANADCGTGGICTPGSGGTMGYCKRTTTTVTCTSTYRAGTATAGEMGRSMFSVSSSNTTTRGPSAPEAKTSNSLELVGFNVLGMAAGDQSTTGVATANRTEVNVSLGRIWSTAAATVEALNKLAGKDNPEPVKPWWKPSLSTPFGGDDPLPGIAFGISAETQLLLGPFPVHVEVKAGVSLGLDVTLHFLSDYQTITKNNDPQYPCLGTSRCVVLQSTTQKTFKEAAEDCAYKGGRLKELRTSADLTDVTTAAGKEAVWVGGFGSHLFDDPRCGDLSSVSQTDAGSVAEACRLNSVTQYFWMGDGGTAFATSYPSGTLLNTDQYLNAHAFGAKLKVIQNSEGAPIPTGLLLAPDGGLQAWRATNELSPGVTIGNAPKTASYVCDFEPAARYDYLEMSLTPGVEFSVGVSAAACVPSDLVGVCVSASFDFINAGLTLELGMKRMNVYPTESAVEPRVKLGTNYVTIDWSVAFLSGGLDFELHYLFGEDSWPIVHYDGVAEYSGNLYERTTQFRNP